MAEPAAALLEAEGLAARLPPLLVEAERVASTVALGLHGRHRSGPGESFWQFRRYQPGDSTARIDWRQSARTDKLFLRETEWLAAQSVWLWVDGSPSMNWRSRRDLPTKRHRALILAMALAALLLRGGERVALLGMAEPPILGRQGLARLAARLPDQPAELPEMVPRNGHVVLLSDFLMPTDQLEARLRGLSGEGLKGQLVQVLDPAEEDFPFHGRTRFSGLEGEGDLLVPQADALRDAYEGRMRALRHWLGETGGRLGWGVIQHRTDAPPQPPLLALHTALSER